MAEFSTCLLVVGRRSSEDCETLLWVQIYRFFRIPGDMVVLEIPGISSRVDKKHKGITPCALACEANHPGTLYRKSWSTTITWQHCTSEGCRHKLESKLLVCP